MRGVKYCSKSQQSQSYQYLHPSMRTVACHFCYSWSLFCLVKNIDFQGQRGKIRSWNTEESLYYTKGGKKNHAHTKEKEIKRHGMKTTYSICGNSVKIFEKIELMKNVNVKNEKCDFLFSRWPCEFFYTALSRILSGTTRLLNTLSSLVRLNSSFTRQCCTFCTNHTILINFNEHLMHLKCVIFTSWNLWLLKG